LISATSVLDDGPANTIFIADVSVAEVTAAFAVLFRVSRIRRVAWEGAFDEFMDDVTWRYKLVGTQRDDFFAAAFLTRRHPLKAYDAVQLAVALRHNQIMVAHGMTTTFVSGDDALIKAAQAEGLLTDNPFDHVSPQDTPRANRTTS